MFFWNEATKTKDVRGHKSKVAQVAWSRLDDRKIASASYDGTAKVWTFSSSGKDTSVELRGHSDAVHQVVWDPINAERLATASNDKSVCFWDARIGKNTKKLMTPGSNLHMCFSPDGNYVLVGNKDDNVSLIDTRQYSVVKELKFSYEVNQFTWNPSGTLIYVTTGAGIIMVLESPTLDHVYSIASHSTGYCIDFDPKGRYFAVGSGDAVGSLWDREENYCQRTFSSMDWPIRSLGFSHDGEFLAMSSEDSFIGIFRVDSGALVYKIPTSVATNSLSWHTSKYLLAYASEEINQRSSFPEGNFRVFGL